MTEWRQIKEKLFYVSNNGDVKNPEGQLLRKHLTYGYYSVCFDGECHYIHRLMAEVFLEKDNNKNFVDHIDRNKKNNNIGNLRWVSRTENNKNREFRETKEKHITKVDDNYFRIRIIKNKIKIFDKYAKSLIDAIELRNNFLENN